MRLKSLDALRGLDMLFLCGLSAVCRGFCKLFPEGEEWAFYSQFEHVRWEGLHFEDLIFPFFIFIAGAAFPFSYARQVEKGMTPKAIHRKILVRLVALVLLGYVYNGHLLGRNYGRFHWWSVLGIIGFAWATAALCYVHFRAKARLAITVALLAGYWTLLQFTAPDAPPGAGLRHRLRSGADRLDRPLVSAQEPHVPEGVTAGSRQTRGARRPNCET